jgi:hypothetical protein
MLVQYSRCQKAKHHLPVDVHNDLVQRKRSRFVASPDGLWVSTVCIGGSMVVVPDTGNENEQPAQERGDSVEPDGSCIVALSLREGVD